MGEYFYSVYGLTVRSEVKLSEMLEITKMKLERDRIK